MPRSKNKVAAKAKRKKILKAAKGFFGRAKNVHTVAKNHVEKAGVHAYSGRKQKKRIYRGIWIQRINAAVRPFGLSYSQFIHKLDEKEIKLNRKVLADLALNNPEAFKAIVDQVK
jgi:large subunit ribosomal protein L20